MGLLLSFITALLLIAALGPAITGILVALGCAAAVFFVPILGAILLPLVLIGKLVEAGDRFQSNAAATFSFRLLTTGLLIFVLGVILLFAISQ